MSYIVQDEPQTRIEAANKPMASSAPLVSIAIFAWNEEAAIGHTLNSLFRQSLFQGLSQEGRICEIICVVNGCTDRTPQVAEEVFRAERGTHPFANTFTARVENLQERGKLNAWNEFVHRLSAPSAEYLMMLDSDIIIHKPDTLLNMVQALRKNTDANISTDQPRKDIHFKKEKGLRERLSLAETQMTSSASAQLCGQLYCIRSETARRIYLPKDLAACEDGFIKSLVCSDFLTKGVNPKRICLAPEAEHTFEAYVSPRALLKNQKRQMIGQTMVHILVDQFLPSLTDGQRRDMVSTLRQKDATDRTWLKRLVAAHLSQMKVFWRLYPNLLGQRFKRWSQLKTRQRIISFPQTMAASALSLIPCYLAYAALKSGVTDYWPRADRTGISGLAAQSAGSLAFTSTTNNPK
jgi:glycosyltransferase involved in cell wall biosynthesis